ncbi:RNA-binding protein 12B-like isoform 1-T3 [Anomaloglossus baeobatrachus]|uniref:RNA-binding protein 12B-like n=1 Tax=Anomaloglossus baeobatrachus TaxID=238106 RepID=UPI003F508838
MSLVIRLQGLPAVADSFDVRQFFFGLNIPRGGVYITGGKYGEAYIVFATYEDSRRALSLSGHILKDSCVLLTYSNEEEMRRALEVFQIGLKPSTSAPYNSEINARGYGNAYLPTFSYIYLHGMPLKATKVDLREFFKGLLVIDVLFLKFINGLRNGNAIVKFGRSTDASEGLKLHHMPICGSAVTLKLSNEVEWTKNGGGHLQTRPRSPPRVSSYARRRSRSRSPLRRRRTRQGSPYVREYYVHLINVSFSAEKRDIKKFFYELDMKDSQITFLVDKEGNRTREAFVMFTTEKDYRRACNLDKDEFKGRTLSILPISKKDMSVLIDRMKVRVSKDQPEKKKASPSRSPQERRYLYLRNFAFDIVKKDVQKFFVESIKSDDVVLLNDSKGVGLGEALVKFPSEKEAVKAEKNNRQTYLGIKVVVSRISEEQMKALKQANQADDTMVSEADDIPDFTSDSTFNMVTSVNTPSAPAPTPAPAPVQTNGEPSKLDSTSEVTTVESETVPPSTKELEPKEESEKVQETVVVENPTEEGLDDANGGEEEMPYEGEETKNAEVTVLFVRNLPPSVTVDELMEFFHDYKVTKDSVILKNIERGIATVRMLSYSEAVSAINTLNKKEMGPNKVFLSLI